MESKNTIPKIKFYNGNEIPQIGFGVYQIKGDELTEKCVLEALKVGYRHIDTAHVYENERGVGQAIKKSGIQESKFGSLQKCGLQNMAQEKQLKRLKIC